MQDYTTFSHSGRAAGVANWSDSYVHGSSSGGGGYLHNGSGHVHGPSTRISTTVVERQRFFVVNDNGYEQPITLSNGQMPVRDGHRITIVYGTIEGKDTGWALMARNHDTGQTAEFRDSLISIRGSLSSKAWASGMAIATVCLAILVLFAALVDGPAIAIGQFFENFFSILIAWGVVTVLGALIAGIWLVIRYSGVDKRIIRMAREAMDEETKLLRQMWQDARDANPPAER
ncbi:MAG: hypothetical protein HXY22_03170 [Alphaproteobacteria bacterium]|nr:hypothetical protein [Alphaproteobacteria bacterium]